MTAVPCREECHVLTVTFCVLCVEHNNNNNNNNNNNKSKISGNNTRKAFSRLSTKTAVLRTSSIMREMLKSEI
jgi:hypothetical protein